MRRNLLLLSIVTVLAGCGGQSQPATPDPQIISQAVQTAVASIPTSAPIEVTRVVEVTKEVPIEVTRVVEVEVTRVITVQIPVTLTVVLSPTPTVEATKSAPTAPAQPAGRFSSPDQIVAAFQAAGLEATDAYPMTKDDYGMAPLVGKGYRFFIPSLGPDNGGRAFIGTVDEIQALQRYYEELAKASAIFFSWVFVSTDGRAMVQINGDLPEDQARPYEAVIWQ